MDFSSSTSHHNVGRKYNKWTPKQEKFLFSQKIIKQHIKKKSTPGKLEGELLIKMSKGILKDKTWKEIKDKIHNVNKKEQRNMRKTAKVLQKKTSTSKKHTKPPRK